MDAQNTARNFSAYLAALRRPHRNLSRLRFLNPDGTTAFSADNNEHNPNSPAFIADGSLSANFQNGARRSASVELAITKRREFEYAVNKIWFGTKIAVDCGLVLPNRTEYYLPMGVFLVRNPDEATNPAARTISYELIDKWGNLDGTIHGKLEATYQVNIGTNIFNAIRQTLLLEKGNGEAIDSVPPVFTHYYDSLTQTLPDSSVVSALLTPYTLTVSNEDGTCADLILGLNTMLGGVIGYDVNGVLRIDPSQEDVEDSTKPVSWRFLEKDPTLISFSTAHKQDEVCNDYIVTGARLTAYTAGGRAQNLDPRSDTNIRLIGRRTLRETNSGFGTNQICRDYAAWKLKRAAALQKSVTITCAPLFHLQENTIVELSRPDKPGNPMERHLINGFSVPLGPTGTMTINATSVSDYPSITIT